jgi:excisionase family DNA binding protein
LDSTEEAYTLTEAAERLGITPRHCRRLVDAGALRAQRTGALNRTRYAITPADLADLERSRQSGTKRSSAE